MNDSTMSNVLLLCLLQLKYQAESPIFSSKIKKIEDLIVNRIPLTFVSKDLISNMLQKTEDVVLATL